MAQDDGRRAWIRGRRSAASALLAGVLFAPLGAAQEGATPERGSAEVGAESGATAATFAGSYEAALRRMEARDWPGARQAWLALLREHAGQDHVRPRVEEIRAALRKCAFWMVTNEPAPRTLVSGELRAFAPSSGRIELRYRADTLADFERVAGAEEDESLVTLGLDLGAPVLYLHPLTFRGPYSLQLEGTPAELLQASLYVALDRGEGYVLQIGGRSGLGAYPHRALALRDGGTHPLAQHAAPEPDAKQGKASKTPRPIKAVVKVDSRRISLTYDGDEVLEVPNEGRVFGRFGLLATGAFGTLTVKGTIEPSWIDGLQDAAVQSAREEFERTWVEPPELAPWRDARPAASAGERVARLLSSLPLPGTFRPQQLALIDEVNAARGQGQAREAAAALREMPAGSLPEDALTLLLTLCEVDAERPAQALDALRAHERLVPLSPALRFLKAHLLLALEGEDEALALLAALAREETGEPLVHFELTRALLGAGRFEEARAALERGLAASDPMTELAELRTQLAKATLGPEWRKTFAHATPRFALASDLDAEICRVAGRELDEAWRKCVEWFGEPAPPAAPTRVFLFSGEASYRGYIRGITRESLDSTLGAYSQLLDQIVAWNSSDRARLLEVLRHECVHHYLDLALGPVPPWLDEGLAEFFAAAKVGPGKWEAGRLHAARLASLRAGAAELTPLAAFLRLDHPAFMARAELHYAQAWALVHFLRTSGDEQGAAFLARLWQTLAGRTDAASALETALADVDLDALERRFLAHANELLGAPSEPRPR